jgi:hypothetical protein
VVGAGQPSGGRDLAEASTVKERGQRQIEDDGSHAGLEGGHQFFVNLGGVEVANLAGQADHRRPGLIVWPAWLILHEARIPPGQIAGVALAERGQQPPHDRGWLGNRYRQCATAQPGAPGDRDRACSDQERDQLP